MSISTSNFYASKPCITSSSLPTFKNPFAANTPPRPSIPKAVSQSQQLEKKIVETLDELIASAERSIRIQHIVRAVFLSIAALLVAATVVIGIFATPFIGITIPLVLFLGLIGLVIRPAYKEAGCQLESDVLNTVNQPKLVLRYGGICANTINLQECAPSFRLSTLKQWLLKQCLDLELRDRIDTALVLGSDELISSNSALVQWRSQIRMCSAVAERYGKLSTVAQKDALFDVEIDGIKSAWKNLQNVSTRHYTSKPIKIENVPLLIGCLKNPKTISLGQCINPEIVQACESVKIQEITLDTTTPIFEETAQALVEMLTLKTLKFTMSYSTKEARAILIKHFRPESAYNPEERLTTWLRV